MLGRYALGRHAIGRTPEEGAYAFNAESGSFAWTGQASDWLMQYVFDAEAGSFAWTGQDADLYSLILTAEAGSFAWTGQDADRAQTKGILRARGSATPSSSGGGRINMRGGRAC